MYELVCIGASWGGLRTLSTLLDALPDDLGVAIAIAQHRGPDRPSGALEAVLGRHTRMPVAEAGDKEPIEPNRIYLAPPDYHLLVDRGSFALTTDERVQHARPSVDVLFETAAEAYGPRAIGIVLTGANEDGAAGLAAMKERGGIAIVQDPDTAEAPAMPAAALRAVAADAVLPVAEMGAFLHRLCSDSAEVSA